jgi:hypothetical protein
MGDKIKLGREAPLRDIASNIKRTYYDAIYGATKVALEPVVAAISDVISDSVSRAVQEGIQEALHPETISSSIREFLFGKKKQR